jgi:hypothetical protein
MTLNSGHLRLPDGALLPLASLGSKPALEREPRNGDVTMTTTTEPARARAVLSNEDFKLLQEAVVFYLKAHEDDPISSKYSNLYHRLGSAIRR